MMDSVKLASLLAKAKSGDEAAFAALYDEFKNTAYATAKLMLRDEDAAEDIVQETALAVYRNLGTIDENGNFFGWVKTVAQNLCKNKLRKKSELLFSEKPDEDGSFDESLLSVADEAETPEQLMDSASLREIVLQLVDALPEEQRIPVVLHYGEGLKVERIAELLEISPNTVKSRLYYARKKMAQQAAEIEERDGIRLHGILPVGLLLGAFEGQKPSLKMPLAASESAFRSAMAKVSGALSMEGAAAGAGAAAAGGIVAKIGAAVASLPVAAKAVAAAVLGIGVIAGGIGLAKGDSPKAAPVFDYWGNTWQDESCTNWELLDLDEDGTVRYIFLREQNGSPVSQSLQEGTWEEAEDGTISVHMSDTPVSTFRAEGAEDYLVVISMAPGTCEFTPDRLTITDTAEEGHFRTFYPVGGDFLPLLPVLDKESNLVFAAGESYAAAVGGDDLSAEDAIPVGGDSYSDFDPTLSDMDYADKVAYVNAILQEPSNAWFDCTDMWLDLWCEKYTGYWTGEREPYFFGIYKEGLDWHFRSGKWDTDMLSTAVIEQLYVGWRAEQPCIMLTGYIPEVAPSEYSSGHPQQDVEIYLLLDISPTEPTHAYIMGENSADSYIYGGESMSEAYENRIS